MIKVFNTLSEYNTYVEGGLVAGDVYYVKEDESAHFQTNNIDGSLGVYDFVPGSGDSDYYLPVLVDASFTANGSYSPADYDADGFDQITIAVPSSGIVPTGTLTISSNGTYDVTNYASAAVSVAAPEPSLNWQTLSGNSLEMNVGTTYVFKTNVAGVFMWHLGKDTDASGSIDNIDDEPQDPLGQMVAGTEYYFTALNEFAGSFDGATHSYMFFAGSSINYETALPEGAVIQYAVLS